MMELNHAEQMALFEGLMDAEYPYQRGGQDLYF